MIRQRVHHYNLIKLPMRPLYLLILSLLFTTACSNEPGISELRDTIMAETSTVSGDISVAYINLDNPDDTLFINETMMFHAASTMKTPVMIEAYKQARDGGITIQDPVLVHNTFKSIVDSSEYSIDPNRDSGRELHEKIGELVPMRDIIYNMTILSGNMATNLVIDIVGADNVMQTMRELEANNIEVLRGVEDMLAFREGLNNRTNSLDLAILFEHLANGTAVSPEADADMIEILKDQRFQRMIPALLPEDVVVAHKTGSITGINHDSGIVYLPDGRRYVLVILAGNLENNSDGTQVGAEISRLVYNWFVEQ